MTEGNNDQPLDFGVNKQNEQEPIYISDTIAENWIKSSRWLSFTGGTLFFAAAYVFCIMLKLINSDIPNILFIITVLLFIAGLYFWNSGKKIGLGTKTTETETVQSGFRMVMILSRYLGALAILSILVLGFALIIILRIRNVY